MNFLTIISIYSIFTILSSFLGFIREVIIAKLVGVNSEMDCFVMGFSIVSFVFLIFNPPTIQSFFMPTYQNFIVSETPEKATEIFNSCLKILGILLLFISFLMFLFGDYCVAFIAPGFNEEQVILTTKVLKILTPLIFIFGSSGLFHSVCNVNKSFIAPLSSQLINNLVIVSLIIILGVDSILYLSGYFVIAAIISFVVLVYFSAKYLERKFIFSDKKSVVKLIMESSSLFLLIFFDQIAALIQKTIASNLESGSIAVLNYAAKLVSFPVSVFAISISTVLFPFLISTAHKQNHLNEAHFHKGLLLIVYCMLPVTIFFMTNDENIVSTLFSSNNFDAAAVKKTSSAFFYYSWGIVFQGLLFYLNRVYLAHKQFILFVKIGLLCVVIHVFLCWIFTIFFDHNGIAIATSAYAILNVVILLYYLSLFTQISLDYKRFKKITLAAIITMACLYSIKHGNGYLYIIRDIIITSSIFYGLLFLLKDSFIFEIIKTYRSRI